MRKKINKLIQNKLVPAVQRALRWAVYALFEATKLVSLAFTTMYFVSALPVVEYFVTGVVLFASFHFTRKRS